MADLLIRDTKLPEDNFFSCLIVKPDGRVFDEEDFGGHRTIAIEIPAHGRLIDADVLKETLMKSAYPEQREWYFAEACQFIDEAPTIIEASKEK